MKILVVDDSEITIKLIESMLKKHKFDVLLAYSAHEAINLLKKQTVDLILSDLNMPIMSGYDLAKSIKMTNKETPFLLYSLKGSNPDLAEVFKRKGIELIGGSDLEEILGTVLQKFDRSIRDNKLKHESL